MNQSNLYTERRKLQDQLATINKLIYGSVELAIAAQIADVACQVDDEKVNILYGHEIVGRLHDLAALAAGPDVDQIYSKEE